MNFLDIIFDLQMKVYKPYRKGNGKPTYVNKNSNHPPDILKQLPKYVENETVRNIIKQKLREKCPNTEGFVARILQYLDLIQRFTE